MIPNKSTIVAALLYTLAIPAENKTPVLWHELSEKDQAVFRSVADFLGQYVVGSQPQDVDRARLAAALTTMTTGTAAANLNAPAAVFMFLTMLRLMP